MKDGRVCFIKLKIQHLKYSVKVKIWLIVFKAQKNPQNWETDRRNKEQVTY